MFDLNGAINLAIRVAAILIVLYVFEITKAVVSTIQGDTLPRKNGMLTLNIFKYFEPIGFLLTFFYGYGWGRPAAVDARSYKNKKTGTLTTFLSPILLSLLMAPVLNILSNLVYSAASGSAAMPYLQAFLQWLSIYFLRIAIFNLIPIPPMCGYEVLKCFLSPNAAFRYGQNAPVIQMGFLFLWFFGFITPLLENVYMVVEKILLG
ncbi:MAG: site-2 protease family protein [Firmicutes bacterium]|nr:site-2 protease family protein [Bacillota bacterium]